MQHKEYNPNTKVIILIRNPIDRMWSSACMTLCRHRGRPIEQVDDAEFIATFERTYRQWRPYLQTIALWRQHFDNVCIEFYDQLQENSRMFFANICNFLDIDEDGVTDGLDKPVNQKIQAELPINSRYHLFSQYEGEINDMVENGIAYAQGWLDEHQAIVEREH